MSNEEMVVVAVDGSPASHNAVRWAANTAAKRGIALQLAASYTMPQFLYAEGMVPPAEIFDELQRETMQSVDRARDIALEVAPDLHIGHAVAEGSPIDMLLRMSNESTMIVMGSRGRAACLAWCWAPFLVLWCRTRTARLWWCARIAR